MIEPMWMWGALGLVLLGIEMATGTFYVLWFGVAALCIALAIWFFPEMPSAVQYAMFSASSLGSLAIWRLIYKKTAKDSRVGQSLGEEIGRIGTVSETCSATKSGKIIFTQGLMGSRIWVAVCNETVEVGCNAKVVAVEGNELRIIKISEQF